MKCWFSILAALVMTTAAFANSQRIYDLDVTVTLRATGEAEIHEVWDLDTGSDITEWYLTRENLGDIRIRDFRVYDESFENGRPFEDVGAWNIDWTRKQKTGRSGIVDKSDGHELCWGIGEYGRHVFHASYLMTNVVKSLNDYDMLHMQFVSPGLSNPPQHVRVTVRPDTATVATQLDTANIRFWGFGYVGSTTLREDGSVVFESGEPFRYRSSVIALMRFDKGIFQPTSIQARDFSAVLDRAMEGADFGEEDEESSLWGTIMGWLWLIIMFIVGRKTVMLATGKVSRWTRRRLLGAREQDITWHRDIPMDGDLIAADYALTRLGEDRKKNAIASAEILRMIYQGFLEVRKDAKGKVELAFSENQETTPTDPVARELWEMMLKASGSDRVLQDKEFSAWSRKNRETLYNWTRRVTTRGKKTFRDKKWSLANRFSPEGQLQARQLLGFKKFLQDFTLTGQRESYEAHLWQEYLVFGALLGVADKVASQLKDIDPVLFEQAVGYDYPTITHVLYSTESLSRAITNSNRAYVNAQANAQSSRGGFGGHSSFGGGGGFSGGGFGGGGR
ncbi:MAG: DUF2207 domain-containing protein [Bacteroidales bacterium]|nr:DUF2207 domain-containing protein [Bacteroidales bacterium]